MLSCTADNKVFGAKNKSVDLKVHYAPVVYVEIETELDPANIREGDSVTMRCHIQARPWVWRILWYVDGEELVASDGKVSRRSKDERQMGM